MRTFSIVLIVLLLPAAAFAQDRRVMWEVGGGPVAPAGTAADAIDAGFGLHIGATVRGTRHLLWKIDALVDRHDVRDDVLGSYRSRYAWIWGVSGNIVLSTSFERTLAFYGIAGAGVYDRTVTLEEPADGVISVCEPWFTICVPDFVPIEQLAGTRSSTEFGYNVGAGLNWRAWPKASLFLEVRIHSLRGDSPGAPSQGAKTADANSRLVPVVLGIRF